MCNLYRMAAPVEEVARLFGAELAGAGNIGGDIFPGLPGMVVAEGVLRPMTWGFPLVRKSTNGQALKPKPVNNARADRLDSPFWRSHFAERRCLIPVTAFAEAAGPKGSKTRSWFSATDAEVFACAGLWRESAQWGRCYTMVMTDACAQIGDLHTRMPVMLAPGEWAQWTDAPSRDAALALCRPWPHGLQVEHTDKPWAG